MSVFDCLAQPAFRLLTLTLIHFFWQGLLIAIALQGLVEVCRVRRSAARYACSLAALMAMTVSPVMTLVVLAGGRYTALPLDPAVFRGLGDVPVTVPPRWSASLALVQPYLVALWLTGVALFGSRLVAGVVGIQRLRRSRIPVPERLVKSIARLGQTLNIDGEHVFLSREIADAMAVGLLRPLVLIPAAWAAELPMELLEAVIAHELAHLARRDLWINLLQRIVETLLFYHPAVWWLSRRLRVERELCADELAVTATGNRLKYVQALEQIAGGRQADIRPALAAFLRGETNMRLLERVRNILDQRPHEQSRLWPAGVAALALPLGLWTAAVFCGPAVADDDREEAKKPTIKRERERGGEEKRVTVRVEAADEGERKDSKEKEKRLSIVVDEDEVKKYQGKPGEKRVRIGERQERPMVHKVPPTAFGAEYRLPNGERVATEWNTQRRDEERAGANERRLDELAGMMKQLAQRVEQLTDDVAQLRGGKPSGKRIEEKGETILRDKRIEDQWGQLDAQKRDLKLAMEKIEMARRQLAEKEAAIDAATKAAAENHTRRSLENLKLELAEKIQRAAADKQKQEAEEKARAAQEKAEEKVRAVRELERARQRKEEESRERESPERKELEKRLKQLQEGKESAALGR